MAVINEDFFDEIGDIVYYQDKPFTGTGILHYDSGEIEYETTYRNGLEHGYVKHLSKDKKILSYSECKKGLKHGETREYSQGGKLLKKGVYEWGVPIAEYELSKEGKLIKTYEIKKNSNDYLLLLEQRKFHESGD